MAKNKNQQDTGAVTFVKDYKGARGVLKGAKSEYNSMEEGSTRAGKNVTPKSSQGAYDKLHNQLDNYKGRTNGR